jgi:hypothetical protein
LTDYERQLIAAAVPELATNIEKVGASIVLSSLTAVSSFLSQGTTFQRAPAAKV